MNPTSTSEKAFLSEDFLLQSDFAKILYHDHARELPIIDYHCHLAPQDISTDRQFETLTKIWLDGDHYKWRAMRTLGIPEHYITGKATDEEKFSKWAFAVPYTVRNPLYHWSHLELKRYFQIDSLLTPDTAKEIYYAANELLSSADYSTRNILRMMNVETLCSTDDPVDTLDPHKKIASDKFSIKVLPAFRPDKAYASEDSAAYITYLDKLSERTGIEVDSFENLLLALKSRIEFFHSMGCRLSDHGLEQLYYPTANNGMKAETIFRKVREHKPLELGETQYFKYALLIELCRMYCTKGWVQQFHLGALRNTNSRMSRTHGPDTGFDSIGDFQHGVSLARFLNELDSTNQLAKTILYNLNPANNELMATMIGNFNDGSVKGKIQFGSAWWFLDQKDGMEKQLNSLSNLGLLSCFIGMTTDSRSFLSYPRHEYFRRILCNLIGQDVESGQLPHDEKWLGKIVSDICYHNAKAYFNFT